MPREYTTPLATICFSSTHSILNRPGSVINCLSTTKPLRRGWSISTRAKAKHHSSLSVFYLVIHTVKSTIKHVCTFVLVVQHGVTESFSIIHSKNMSMSRYGVVTSHLDHARHASRQSRPLTTSSAKMSAWVIIRFDRSAPVALYSVSNRPLNF